MTKVNMSNKESKKIKPLVKVNGDKYHLNKWILSHFPDEYENLVYCEPFGGAASILLNKTPSIQEFYNDLDLGLVQILRSLRDDPSSFISRVKKIKFQESTFIKYQKKQANEDYLDYVDHAICEFVVRKMSRGGIGKTFAQSESEKINASSWDIAITSLSDVAKRIENVIITNKHILEIISSFNDPKCLLFVDPPNLPEVRSTKKNSFIGMTSEEHLKFVKTINGFQSKTIIVCQNSRLYEKVLKNWNKIEKPVSDQKNKQKNEVLWTNF